MSDAGLRPADHPPEVVAAPADRRLSQPAPSDPQALALRRPEPEVTPMTDAAREKPAKYLVSAVPVDNRLRPFTDALANLLFADLVHDDKPK